MSSFYQFILKSAKFVSESLGSLKVLYVEWNRKVGETRKSPFFFSPLINL